MWSTAHEMGVYKQLVESLKTTVTTAVVGPVTAQPLLDAGIIPLVPERFRMGALIRLVCEHLALNHVRRLDTASGNVELRGRSPADRRRARSTWHRRRCCCCARSWAPAGPCSPGNRSRSSWN